MVAGREFTKQYYSHNRIKPKTGHGAPIRVQMFGPKAKEDSINFALQTSRCRAIWVRGITAFGYAQIVRDIAR